MTIHEIPTFVNNRYEVIPLSRTLPYKDRAVPNGLSEVDPEDLSYEEVARLLAFGYSVLEEDKRNRRDYKNIFPSSLEYMRECLDCIEREDKLGERKGVLDLCKKQTEWLHELVKIAKRRRRR